MELQRESEIAAATRGKVSLPFGFWALAWSILLTVLGLAMSIGIAQSNITLRLANLESSMVSISSRLERHVESPGHMISIERLNQINQRLDSIDPPRRTSRP